MIKQWIKEEYDWMKGFLNVMVLAWRCRKREHLYFICTPLHKNLGDHAITIACYNFFHTYIPETKIIEVSQPVIRKHTRVFKNIFQKQLVIVCGGGYLGDAWPDDDKMVIDVVKYCTDSKIIILPQTISFTTKNQEIYAHDKYIVSHHQNLIICVRDSKSVYWAKKLKCSSQNIVFMPDMVTYLSQYKDISKKRDGIAVCLREDREKNIDFGKDVLGIVKSMGEEVKYIDNIYNRGNVLPEKRYKIVEQHLQKIASAKVLITDRLHGMLFATITSTPCIAFDNTTGKVRGGYHWIKNNSYVRVLSDLNEFEETLQDLINVEDCIYDNKESNQYFDKLAKLIINYLG